MKTSKWIQAVIITFGLALMGVALWQTVNTPESHPYATYAIGPGSTLSLHRTGWDPQLNNYADELIVSIHSDGSVWQGKDVETTPYPILAKFQVPVPDNNFSSGSPESHWVQTPGEFTLGEVCPQIPQPSYISTLLPYTVTQESSLLYSISPIVQRPMQFYVGSRIIALVIFVQGDSKKEVLYQYLSNGDVYVTVTITDEKGNKVDGLPGGRFLSADDKELLKGDREILDKRLTDEAEVRIQAAKTAAENHVVVTQEEKVEVTPAVEALAAKKQQVIDEVKAVEEAAKAEAVEAAKEVTPNK